MIWVGALFALRSPRRPSPPPCPAAAARRCPPPSAARPRRPRQPAAASRRCRCASPPRVRRPLGSWSSTPPLSRKKHEQMTRSVGYAYPWDYVGDPAAAPRAPTWASTGGGGGRDGRAAPLSPGLARRRRTGGGVEKGPKTEAGKRVIALDQETVQAFLAHQELVGGRAYGRIFTSPGGSRGPTGTLANNNFARVWKRPLAKVALGPSVGRGRRAALPRPAAQARHLADRPASAHDGRRRQPGAGNAVVTMMVYAHMDKLVDRGLLTADELGLAGPAGLPARPPAPAPLSSLAKSSPAELIRAPASGGAGGARRPSGSAPE
jgi:hypothetical protein